MNKYIFILAFCAAHGFMDGQSTVNSDSLCNLQKVAERIAFNKFGVCTIFLKDGTEIRNCALKEIKALWIIYQKNKTLHNLMIERIDCILPIAEDFVLWFNDKKEPIISKKCKVQDK